VKEKDQKERDWDREMREVDRLLAKLPEADPALGRGVPTVPVSPRPGLGVGAGGTLPASPARGRAWITTWMRVGLGLALGIGMIVWPYSHACGLKLVFYLIGATAVTVAGVWSAANFSYRAEPVIADRFVALGDAVTFVDPIFSTGVYVNCCPVCTEKLPFHSSVPNRQRHDRAC